MIIYMKDEYSDNEYPHLCMMQGILPISMTI